jgi:ribosomal-protein-alanine acetyltransferase
VIRLCEAGAADAPLFAALAARCLREAWSRSGYAEGLARPSARGLLAREGEEAVGFLLADRVRDEIHVLAVAVVPEQRRRGIARALVLAALARAAGEGATRAHLEVRAGNAAALALYGSLGFAEVGRRPRYYTDGEDALLLTAPVAAAPESAARAACEGAP